MVQEQSSLLSLIELDMSDIRGDTFVQTSLNHRIASHMWHGKT